MSKPPKASPAVQAYLDAVAHKLKHLPRRYRKRVLTALRTQIDEAAERHAAGVPDEGDYDAVLAELHTNAQGVDRQAEARRVQSLTAALKARVKPHRAKGYPFSRALSYVFMRHGLLPLGLCVCAVFILPYYRGVVDKLEGKPPAFTQLLMDLAEGAQSAWPMALAAGAVVLIADAIVYTLLRRMLGKTVGGLYSFGILAAEAVAVLLFILALALPMAGFAGSLLK